MNITLMAFGSRGDVQPFRWFFEREVFAVAGKA